MTNLVLACLLAVLVYAYPAGYVHANTVRGSITFEIDESLKEPKTMQIACPCKGDYKLATVNTKKKIGLTKVNKSNYCSCVIYAKSQTGFSTPNGLARYWPSNTDTPLVGGVVVTSESMAGHVAVISEVGSTWIKVREANYSKCRLTTRIIARDSKVIIGYWSP